MAGRRRDHRPPGDDLLRHGRQQTRKKTDIWYQTSTDDGVTWSAAAKVTTAQTDETIAGADPGNQYGDYNSLSIYAGKIFPSWTDRRSGGKEEIWTAPVTVP